MSGFPIVAIILLVVFGSLAAAALPLALGFVSVHRHRRAHLLHLAADDDLGLRHQHGLDDRDRGRDRLLAVHPRPLPRGARRRPQPTRRPATEALSTSGLAVTFSGLAVIVSLGRPLDGRQPGAALDGAGGDDRRRRLDPDRDDPAAGPDRHARRPRHARAVVVGPEVRAPLHAPIPSSPAIPGRGSEGQSISVSSGRREQRRWRNDAWRSLSEVSGRGGRGT